MRSNREMCSRASRSGKAEILTSSRLEERRSAITRKPADNRSAGFICSASSLVRVLVQVVQGALGVGFGGCVGGDGAGRGGVDPADAGRISTSDAVGTLAGADGQCGDCPQIGAIDKRAGLGGVEVAGAVAVGGEGGQDVGLRRIGS